MSVNNILKGFKEIKNIEGVFVSDKEIVITGIPEEEHNCDEIGCSSVSHVIFRKTFDEQLEKDVAFWRNIAESCQCNDG